VNEESSGKISHRPQTTHWHDQISDFEPFLVHASIRIIG
jgi:hypothetical protein